MNRPISLGAESMLGVIHKVLDHGELQLIDYMGNDESIARIARVSTGSERQDLGILPFLVRHRHTSPIEFGKLTLRAKVPFFWPASGFGTVQGLFPNTVCGISLQSTLAMCQRPIFVKLRWPQESNKAVAKR